MIVVELRFSLEYGKNRYSKSQNRLCDLQVRSSPWCCSQVSRRLYSYLVEYARLNATKHGPVVVVVHLQVVRVMDTARHLLAPTRGRIFSARSHVPCPSRTVARSGVLHSSTVSSRLSCRVPLTVLSGPTSSRRRYTLSLRCDMVFWLSVRCSKGLIQTGRVLLQWDIITRL